MKNPSLIESLSRAGLEPPALVLDVGCGTGLQARELARAGFRVVAADMDFDAVITGSRLDATDFTAALAFLAARCEAVPFRNAAFDAVVCLDVFHWAESPGAFGTMWGESWRVLRPGGLFHARCLCRDFLPSAAPVGHGRFRLDSGAEWFLPSRPDFDAALAAAEGEWLVPPDTGEADRQGAVRMLARKPA